MATVSKILQKKIMELMMDQNSRDIPGIKEDLARKKDFVYKRDYREGHLAGVLRVLSSNGELEKVERGVYTLGRTGRQPFTRPQRTEMAEEDSQELLTAGEASLEQIWQEALFSLEAQYQSLVARMDAVAMSSLTPADFEYVKKLSELKEELKGVLMRYGVRN